MGGSSPETSDVSSERKSGRLCLDLCRRVTLEPVAFAYIFTFGFQAVISQRLVLEKVCSVDLELDGSVCGDLKAHFEEQVDVQQRSNVILTAQVSLSVVPGLILCVFLGPWSDEKGRKPLVVLPVLGTVISYTYLAIFASWDELGGWWYIISSVDSLIGGGPMVFLTGVFSYYTDNTTTQNRTSQLAILNILILSGFPFGVFAGGLVFKALGYNGVFIVASVLETCNAIYLVLCVKEKRETKHPHSSTPSTESKSTLKIWHIISSVFLISFRPREGYGRMILILLMLIVLLSGTQVSSDIYLYRYTRLKLGWDTLGYSLFSSLTAFYAALGIIIMLPVLMSQAVDDTTVGIMGNMSTLAYCLLIAFARSSEWIYAAGASGIFMGLVPVTIRSMLSKVGGSSEVGAIFAMMSLVETLVPLAMNPLVALLYNDTIATFPGALYCVLAALNLVMTAIFFTIRLISKGEGYTQIEED